MGKTKLGKQLKTAQQARTTHLARGLDPSVGTSSGVVLKASAWPPAGRIMKLTGLTQNLGQP